MFQTTINIIVLIGFIGAINLCFKWLMYPWNWWVSACFLIAFICLLMVVTGFEKWLIDYLFKVLSMNIWSF